MCFRAALFESNIKMQIQLREALISHVENTFTSFFCSLCRLLFFYTSLLLKKETIVPLRVHDKRTRERASSRGGLCQRRLRISQIVSK